MSILNHAADAGLHTSLYNVLTMGVFGMKMNVTIEKPADIFAKGRMKFDLLPPIDQCQSNIFNELQQREADRAIKVEAAVAPKPQRSVFGGMMRFGAKHFQLAHKPELEAIAA